ncbi:MULTISPECIES: ABC transporter permease [Clostridium]|uniref:Bicarbonate transport system permease protein CmpB n=1 Tax=Clostridium colicanis DSM 13634 TaxID=1121305 RepID=A0A151AKL2_9CLOT|nr:MULTISPECIES: ABC transporter permease [Clostridium]KYH28162.1 bicarbonate transport system permease protein CmpB [Clostridium colicanis DSM 13634]MBE6044240.1 ABC transporter permease [Clostridium thermopalmarium]
MKNKSNFRMVLPMITLLIAISVSKFVPDKLAIYKTTFWIPVLIGILVIILLLNIVSLKNSTLHHKLEEKSPLISAGILLLCLWEVLTSKLTILPMPYFPAPGQVVDVIITDWRMLGISTLYSLRMLVIGYSIGAILGLVTGVMIGWNPKLNYWLSPLQKVIGPIPATAWIPIAMTLFPSSFTASVFILALAVWFPVTVMTSSGIANVQKSYFEVAQTLGADKYYQIFRVAIPASLPNIFIGLFMGLGTSFVTLIVAEMLGVKAGLGWYINWAQGWAEYKKVYASLVVMSILFSTIITLLFKMRDKILVWQKGLIKW